MNDPYFDLLMWARGPGFTIALVVLAGGIILRLTEILFLGRKTDLAPAKGNAVVAGLKTIFTRSVPREGLVKFSPVTYIGGYVFHIAFFIAFLLFGPHIALIKSVIGLSWPDAGRVIIESAAVIALVAMLALLYSRITDPVRRSISGFQDYLV
jgi:nitrate reductase gamma subunit